jgi:hypothetical protein
MFLLLLAGVFSAQSPRKPDYTCAQGLEIIFGKSQGTTSTAEAKSDSYSGSHVLRLQGSFVAPWTGDYTFTLYSKTSGLSSGYTSEVTFGFDGYYKGPKASQWVVHHQITKDYRYVLMLETSENYMYVKISISGAQSDSAPSVLAGDLIGTCYATGCRDFVMERDNGCQPTAARHAAWRGQVRTAPEDTGKREIAKGTSSDPVPSMFCSAFVANIPSLMTGLCRCALRPSRGTTPHDVPANSRTTEYALCRPINRPYRKVVFENLDLNVPSMGQYQRR